jgi:isoleucyl-tRNA synthetase
MARLLAPVLTFTADEVWQHIPSAAGSCSSVFFAGLPEVEPRSEPDEALYSRFDVLRKARSAVTGALEVARSGGMIGKSLEAEVTLTAPDSKTLAVLTEHEDLLADLFIVSAVDLSPEPRAPQPGPDGDGSDFIVDVRRSDGDRCDRCWKYTHDGITDAEHPGLCARCAAVVKQDEALN